MNTHQHYEGDPRRCSIHGTVTSSDDGMHDAPCGDCESEMMDMMAEDQEREFMALPQAERIEIYLDGAQVRSHLRSCPVIPAAPVDYSDIPF